VCAVLIPETIQLTFRISEGLEFLLSDIKFMNTCSFTGHFKKFNACSKVLVESDNFFLQRHVYY
jgi:hypothetical protein